MTPDPERTTLINEVYRGTISSLQVSPGQASQFVALLVLPEDTGGFVVREVGLLTDKGELYSVASCAAIEKPKTGVSINLQYRLAVSETAEIELKVSTGDGLFLRIDQNGADIADKNEFIQNLGLQETVDLAADALPGSILGVIKDGGIMASANKPGWWLVQVADPSTVPDFPKYPGGEELYGYGMLFVQIHNNVWLQHYYGDTGKNAKRQAWSGGPSQDEEWVIDYNTQHDPVNILYPVGIVLFFAVHQDPNRLFPGTTWNYIGENKTIRLAKQDASDLMTTGGSDSVKLSVSQLPAHGHTFSATTGSFDYGTKTTNTTGNHYHTVGTSTGTASPEGGGDFTALATGSGHNINTTATGNHSHTVAIGAHSHTVSGTTANTGSGSAVTVTNAYIKLLAWYRSG